MAREIDPAEVFSAVAEEIHRLLGADSAAMGRFDPDGTSAVIVSRAAAGRGAALPGPRVPVLARPVRLIDATPVPCGASRETVKRSELAGWAGYG